MVQHIYELCIKIVCHHSSVTQKKKKKIKHLSIYIIIIIIYIKSKLLKPTQFSTLAQYLNKIIILFK